MFRITQELPRASSDFEHGGFTLSAGAFHLLALSSKVPQRGPTTPEASFRFGLLRFRSPLLTQSILFLFLRLLRCFTSPGIACFSLPSPFKGLQEKTMEHYLHQVTPFGNLRIKAYVPLPEAYRSLSRPSSPVGTKASTVCPLKLDSLFEISHADCVRIGDCGSWIADLPFASFHALWIFRSTYNQSMTGHFAVKINMYLGIRIYSRTTRTSHFSHAFLLRAVTFFSLQSLLIFLHVDVKERTLPYHSVLIHHVFSLKTFPFFARKDVEWWA